MHKLSLNIQQMTCAGCASKIEREIGKLPHVQKSSVNFALSLGHFEFDKKEAEDVIKKRIEELGYKFTSSGNKKEEVKNKESKNFQKFVFSFILSLMIFGFEMGPFHGWPKLRINWMIQFALCTPIWLWIGLKFQKALLVFFKKNILVI